VGLGLTLSVLAQPAPDPVETAQALIADGRFRDARQVLEPSSDDEALGPQRLLLLIRVLNTLQDFELGERYGKLAVERMPDSSEAHYRYAEALRVKMDRSSRMAAMLVVGKYKAELQRALELDPANVLARVEEIGFMINAPAIVGGGNARARARIDELAKIDSRRALMMHGVLELNSENHEQAVQLLDQLFRNYPDESECHRVLARWYQADGRYTEADRHLAALSESDDPTQTATAR
jgi:Tfp pilus assembly protein PilF